MSRCMGHQRHWFAPRGMPSVIVPRCVRCDAPNPKWTEVTAAVMEVMGFGADWRAENDHHEHTASGSKAEPS